MPQPDWVAIFTLRPDLEPPGYAETVIDMIDRPWVPPERRSHTSSSSGPNRFPSLKHGAD
jgi:hypothetical protein